MVAADFDQTLMLSFQSQADLAVMPIVIVRALFDSNVCFFVLILITFMAHYTACDFVKFNFGTFWHILAIFSTLAKIKPTNILFTMHKLNGTYPIDHN